MEWIGLAALGILLCYSSYPGKVRQLEKRLRRLERKRRGESEMSRLVNELVGKECEIDLEDSVDWGDKLKCRVLDADDEWVKVSYTVKKKEQEHQKTRMFRIENIEGIKLDEGYDFGRDVVL